jgi:hypothetical protein
MTTVGNYFTLSDFDNMKFSSNMYTLSENVMNTIAYLNTNIEIPEFTPYVSRGEPVRSTYSNHTTDKDANVSRNRSNHRIGTRNKTDSVPQNAEDWELMRSFKTTKMEVKTGVEKTINDIRIHLNKMSAGNYVKQRDTIITEIRNYVECENANHEHIDKIASAIFDIASGNKFFSELYAELYRELVLHFSVFADILQRFVQKFNETIDNIEYVDSDADYDGFCRVTKNNDKRKATTTFIVNVMKKGLVSHQSVLDIVCVFMDRIIQYVSEPNSIHQMEEVCENIFLFISMCSKEFKTNLKWREYIVPSILHITQNPKQSNMSNRVLFKFMDMVEFTK